MNQNMIQPKNKPEIRVDPQLSEAQSKAELDRLAQGSNTDIFTCHTLFPFTLFPDTISVDLNKVEILKRFFIFSKYTQRVMLDDIRFVTVNKNLLFASVNFEVIGFEKNPPQVRFLATYDALRLRNIVMGLIAARRRNVDLRALRTQELIEKVEKIGESSGDENLI